MNPNGARGRGECLVVMCLDEQTRCQRKRCLAVLPLDAHTVPEEKVTVSLWCAWMNIQGDKNEFHSRMDSNFDEAKITNCIVGTSDMTVHGYGNRPTCGCTL
jgi:hypothetical protein